MVRAAIIGLGQIGSRFDEDPKRTGVWSHAGAYAQVSEVRLVAGADTDRGARDRFVARRGIAAVYEDYRALLAQEQPDLVSICSPTHLHAEMTLAAVEAGVKGIFCEKPIAESVESARRMVSRCRERGVVLAVNHTRRWDRNYLWPLRLLREGRIGAMQRVVAYYSARIFNIGTHLLDTIHMFTNASADWVSAEFTSAPDDPDPTAAGLMFFPGDMMGMIVPLNKPSDLIFELDLFGTEGRLRILDNGLRQESYQFEESPHYSHYRELHRKEWINPLPMTDRFVDAVRDLVSCLTTGQEPACGGTEGLAALETAVALCRSAASGGTRQTMPLGN